MFLFSFDCVEFCVEFFNRKINYQFKYIPNNFKLYGGIMHKNDRIIILLGFFITLIALVGAAVGGIPKAIDDSEEDFVDFTSWDVRTSSTTHVSGTGVENSDETISINTLK